MLKDNRIIVIHNGKERTAKRRDLRGLDIKLSGRNNTITIELPNSFDNSIIQMDGDNNNLYIGASHIGFRNLEILMLASGNNRKLSFGEGCSCEGLSIFHHNHNSTLTIGNNVMFARNCLIQTCDSHCIMDLKTHELLNNDETHMVLGDNIWCAQGTTILKKAMIPSNTIVGCGSTVTKPFTSENTVIAGVPAQVVRKNITWSRFSPNYISCIDTDKIHQCDITFVVQGAVDKTWTPRCLKSIRAHFPMSHIILSTWVGADTSAFAYLCDKIIYNKDPGGTPHFRFQVNSPTFNLDRQITSTKNGLKAVKTKYAVKIRSDMIVKNRNMLKYFDSLDKYDKKYKLFTKRIVSFAAYRPFSASGKRSWNWCMHDYGYFGLTSDLLKLWDIPLMSDTEKHYWKTTHKDKYPTTSDNNECYINMWLLEHRPNYQYHAEQYILLKCFTKLKGLKIKFKHMFDFNDDDIELFKRIVANNFVPLYSNRIGISLPRDAQEYNTAYISELDYTYPEFLALYNKYANGNAEAQNSDPEREKWKQAAKRGKKTRLYKLLHFYWLRGKK